MPVTLHDVGMRFGARVVLDGLHAELPAGRVSALMGPSGAGKSTVLAIVAGHLRPTSGRVVVTAGAPVPGAPVPGAPAGGMAPTAEVEVEWMVQSTPVLSRRTAWDNAALGALARGVARPRAMAEAADVLDRLGLDEVRGTRAYRLSGGERQRVAVARSIVRRTPVLLADEPTASLDPESRAAVCAAFRAAADAGATVVLATHDPVVAGLCDLVVDLDEAGR